jgi:hypothetical protein
MDDDRHIEGMLIGRGGERELGEKPGLRYSVFWDITACSILKVN